MVTVKLYIKKMMIWFDYVYYRVYVAYQKRKEPDPYMYATSIVALCQCLNFFIIDTIFKYFTNMYITALLGKPILVIIMFIVLGLNYRRYDHNNKRSYRKFHSIWKNEPKDVRHKRGWLVMIYILASVLFPIVYGFIKHNIMEGKSFIHG
jgi:ABC-type amino acid transport system permease subunit